MLHKSRGVFLSEVAEALQACCGHTKLKVTILEIRGSCLGSSPRIIGCYLGTIWSLFGRYFCYMCLFGRYLVAIFATSVCLVAIWSLFLGFGPNALTIGVSMLTHIAIVLPWLGQYLSLTWRKMARQDCLAKALGIYAASLRIS